MTTSEYHRERQQGQLVADFIAGPEPAERPPEAERLDMLRSAMRRGGGEATVAVIDLDTGGHRFGQAFGLLANGRFHVAFGPRNILSYISQNEIGQRVFIAAPWPDDSLHAEAVTDGSCPQCGEHLEWFPVAGVVACADDCGWGHEIEAFPAQVMKAAVNA